MPYGHTYKYYIVVICCFLSHQVDVYRFTDCWMTRDLHRAWHPRGDTDKHVKTKKKKKKKKNFQPFLFQPKYDKRDDLGLDIINFSRFYFLFISLYLFIYFIYFYLFFFYFFIFFFFFFFLMATFLVPLLPMVLYSTAHRKVIRQEDLRGVPIITLPSIRNQ